MAGLTLSHYGFIRSGGIRQSKNYLAPLANKRGKLHNLGSAKKVPGFLHISIQREIAYTASDLYTKLTKLLLVKGMAQG